MLNPSSDCLVRNIDPALGHQFFNLTQAQIKSKIQPDNTLNHIRMKTAAMINGDFHLANLTLNAKTASLCDKTVWTIGRWKKYGDKLVVLKAALGDLVD